MRQHILRNGKPLIAALLMSGAVGFAGQGLAQSTSGDQSGAPTAQRPPAAANSGSSSSGAYSASPTGPSGQSMSPSGTGPMTSAKGIAPSKSEMSDSAFKKLDASNKGYVTRDDAKSLSGFDNSFQAADSDHDGKLTVDEFKKAWTSYTGNTQ
jgi:hypothetical protein